jgi:hypothetical protein
MKLFNQLLAVFGVIFGLFSLTPLVYAETDSSPVQWEEIKGWRNLGPNWVGGLNEQGELLAIYDLAFPTGAGSFLLGTLDSTSAGYGKVITLLKAAKKEASSGNKIESLNDAQNMGEVNEAIQSLEKLEAHAKALEDSAPVGAYIATAETQWWKSVPWKSDSVRNSKVPPTDFSFSDIRVNEWIKKTHLQSLGSATSFAAKSAIRNLQFHRNPNGLYELYWVTGPGAAADTLSRPVKIADLRCVRCGFDEQLTQSGIREGITKVLNQVPVPYLSGLAKSAVDEYFMFQDRLLFHHQQMVLEVIQESPDLFTDQERERAVSSIYYARSSATDAKKWVDHRPIDEFNHDEADASKRAVDAAKYLNEHKMPVILMSPRFGVVGNEGDLASGNLKLFSLSAPRYFNILATFLSFDAEHPFRIRNERIAIETAHILVQFLNIFSPIPIVGPAVAKAFDWLLESRMHTLQEWEARLLAQLSLRNTRSENWDQPIDLIGQQAINPMEASRATREALVLSRKSAFAIP